MNNDPLYKRYPYIAPGVIVRKRNCGFSQPENLLAISANNHQYSLNTDMFDFLELCTGERTFGDIQRILASDDQDLNDAIDSLVTRNLISTRDTSLYNPLHLKQIRKPEYTPAACRSAVWHITRRCNQHCSHCYYLKEDVYRLDFDEKEIRAIVSQLSALGVEHVTLSGGEVSTAKTALQLAASLLNDACIPFWINTNGTGDPEFFINLCKSYGYLRTIQTSLDGHPENHDSLRNMKGAFSRTASFVSTLKTTNVRVRIVSMLTKDWEDPASIVALADSIATLAPSEWLIEVPSSAGRWAERLIPERTKAVLDAAIALGQYCLTTRPKMSIVFNQVFQWPPQNYIAKTLEDTICSHDRGLLSFGTEGVSFCGLFLNSFGESWKGFANPATSLLVAWDKIAEARVSRKISDNIACRNCELFDVCQGGCPGQYADAENFQGCDFHSRTLALAKRELMHINPALFSLH